MSYESEQRICALTGEPFTVHPEDFAYYEKIGVPPPTWSPIARQMRRMAWRNERSLYKRTCDLTGKSIVSMYPADAPFPVYEISAWRSDDWDALDYGREYNWDRPFFEQFRGLLQVVPQPSLMQIGQIVDSEYCNWVADAKNIYLSQSVVRSEGVYHSRSIDDSSDVVDCMATANSEFVYENFDCEKNFRCQYCSLSRSCVECLYCYDCVNCQNCFMSANLRNAQYVFRGEQLGKAEYEQAIAELELGAYSSREVLEVEFIRLRQKAIHKYASITQCQNCTGDTLKNCNNVKDAFIVINSENCRYGFRGLNATDAYDFTGLGNSELMYETLGGGFNGNNNRFVAASNTLSNSDYINFCTTCDNLFGCVGMRNNQYCILNKQYTESEYTDMRTKIIQHMYDMPYTDSVGHVYTYGELFPPEFAPSGYNETIAQDYFPLTREQATEYGFRWTDIPEPDHQSTIETADVPDNVADVPDLYIQESIRCVESGKVFRITSYELDFYRRMNIPVPRLHPDVRYRHRLEQRNPLQLWERTTEDGVTVMSTYAPDRPEKIYSEEGYQKLVL